MPDRDEKSIQAWRPQGLDMHWEHATRGNTKGVECQLNRLALRAVPSPSNAAAPITEATDEGTLGNHWARDSVHEIDALCNVIAACAVSSTHLGTFTDSTEPCQYDVHSSPKQTRPSKSVTLLAALQREHPQRVWRNRPRQFQLALAIASAHLQLIAVAWISSHWSIKDILFPQDGCADLEMPFVQGDFKERAAQICRRPDKAFTSLGIILMDLLFGEVLDDHPLWQRDGWSAMRSDLYMRMIVAKQWLEDVLLEGSRLYFAAVQWCLTESPATLEGEQWRKDLVDRVVLPLEGSCRWIHEGDTE